MQHKIKLLDQLLLLAAGMSELEHVMLAIPIGYVALAGLTDCFCLTKKMRPWIMRAKVELLLESRKNRWKKQLSKD